MWVKTQKLNDLSTLSWNDCFKTYSLLRYYTLTCSNLGVYNWVFIQIFCCIKFYRAVILQVSRQVFVYAPIKHHFFQWICQLQNCVPQKKTMQDDEKQVVQRLDIRVPALGAIRDRLLAQNGMSVICSWAKPNINSRNCVFVSQLRCVKLYKAHPRPRSACQSICAYAGASRRCV